MHDNHPGVESHPHSTNALDLEPARSKSQGAVMCYSSFGQTGLFASELCLGAMTFGSGASGGRARELLGAQHERHAGRYAAKALLKAIAGTRPSGSVSCRPIHTSVEIVDKQALDNSNLGAVSQAMGSARHRRVQRLNAPEGRRRTRSELP